jgi:hypothetical protein
LLKDVFDTLNLRHIAYCVLRDGNVLETLNLRGAEIDFLVQGDQFQQFDRTMRELGFQPFSRWGYAPHTHYIKSLEEGAFSFEFDVVTHIAFGTPVRNLKTDLAANCLDNRRLVDGVYIPRAEEELFIVLLHCLLDKNQIKPHRAARIQVLREQIAYKNYMDSLCARFWSSKTSWLEIDQMIARGDWPALLAQRKSVALHLMRQDMLGTWTRAIGQRALRKLDRIARISRTPLPSKA